MLPIEPDEDLPETSGTNETEDNSVSSVEDSDASNPPIPNQIAPEVEPSIPLAMDVSDAGEGSNGSAFMGVPIEVTISVGKARPLVNDLVKLRRDSVIGLDTKIDDPVEVYIGDKLIARGELEEMEDGEGQLAVRLTEVADVAGGA